MLLQLGTLCSKPSINAASHAAVSSAAAPVLLLTEQLGNKPVAPPPGQGCHRGPPHTPKAGELLPAVLPEGSELGVRPRACSPGTTSAKGLAHEQSCRRWRCLCGMWGSPTAQGLIQQVKIMLLLRLAEG